LVLAAVVALAAGCGSSGDGVRTGAPRRLPIAVGGAAGEADAAMPAMAPYEHRTYVAAEDLPALTGPAGQESAGGEHDNRGRGDPYDCSHPDNLPRHSRSDRRAGAALPAH
jgi:hypothetical protein